jgi:hypothetical protein
LPSEETSVKPRVAVIAATVVLIALLAFVPVLLRGADPGEPAALRTPTPEATPTSTPPSTPSPLATTEPPERTRPTEAADPEAAPDGRSEVDDPSGDVVDTAGEAAPGPAAAADLVAVALEADGESLEVTFSLAGAVPDGGQHSLLWSVELYDGGEPRYSVTVQQIGARRLAGVLDWESLEQVAPPDPPIVDGDVVRVRVPLELLPDLPASFTWRALGQLDGGYEDRAPDDGAAPFPQS